MSVSYLCKHFSKFLSSDEDHPIYHDILKGFILCMLVGDIGEYVCEIIKNLNVDLMLLFRD